jgi:hypothetical protein
VASSIEGDRVRIGLNQRPPKEVVEMWKSLLDALLESCIAMDPVAYVYWQAAQRELAPAEPPADERRRREAKVVALERRWETSL